MAKIDKLSAADAKAMEALKLIKMPAQKAKAVFERVATDKVKPSGDGFDRTGQRGQFNRVATKSVSASAVGRSLVARSSVPKESKPLSKAGSVMRAYDAADPATKREILKHAVSTAYANTETNFSKDGDKVIE